MKVKIITKLEEYISDELDRVTNDKTINKEDKLEAYGVYHNIFLFLRDYDKNIQILQRGQER